jgi:hypothetical protein
MRSIPRSRICSPAAFGKVVIPLCCLLFQLGPMQAQVNTRAAQIEQARREKAANIKPEEVSKAEARLNYIIDSKILERLTAGIGGVRVIFGGLATGQGFALGPEYFRPDLADGNVLFRAGARASGARGLLLDLQTGMPNLAGGKMFVDFLAAHRNFPRVEYFGPGPGSKEESRTQFRYEDTTFDLNLGVRPWRPLSLGVTGGYLLANTGPGNRHGIGQAHESFGPAQAPGIDTQSDFLRSGVFAQLDYRDHPGGPRSGGFYSARFTHFDDRDLNVHNFRRLDFEAQQYLPFFQKRRVIALRARTVMTFTNGAGQSVPFYLQPYLGGSDDLRGFRPYRFYDDNHIVVNAEYRWESFTGLDVALFFDAGKVVPKRSQINFHDLEASAGFGFRFNVRNAVFLRIDVGFSHEGTMIWLKFNNIF